MKTTNKTLILGGTEVEFEVLFDEVRENGFQQQKTVYYMAREFKTVFLCSTLISEYQAFSPIVQDWGFIHYESIWRRNDPLSFDNLLKLIEILGFPDGFDTVTKTRLFDEFRTKVLEEKLQHLFTLDIFTPETLRFRTNDKCKKAVCSRFVKLSEKYFDKLSRSDFQSYSTAGKNLFLGKL